VVAAGFFVDVPVDVLGGSAAARCRAVVVVGVVALGVAVLGVAVLAAVVLAAVVRRAAGGGATARRTAPAAARAAASSAPLPTPTPAATAGGELGTGVVEVVAGVVVVAVALSDVDQVAAVGVGGRSLPPQPVRTAARTAGRATTMAGRTTGTSEREDHPLRPGGHGQPFEKGGTGTPPDAARAPVSPDRCVAGPLRLEITTSPDHCRRVAAMRGGGRP
jgi:hypothetical protein